jgi:hypothetical protein
MRELTVHSLTAVKATIVAPSPGVSRWIWGHHNLMTHGGLACSARLSQHDSITLDIADAGQRHVMDRASALT